MSKMLLMTSLGHAGTSNSQTLENLVAAGHGFYAHAANIPSSGQEVIDKAQQTVSHISTEASELPATLRVSVPNVVSSVNHSWSSHAIKVAYPISEVIPTLEGWL